MPRIPPNQTGFKHTEETKNIIRMARKGKKITWDSPSKFKSGENHPNWKGGRPNCICGKKLTSIRGKICMKCIKKNSITPKLKLLRDSKEYTLWRTAVFQRDNYTCIWCGARNGNGKTVEIQADHIKPFAFFPELRFAIDNGRTLCRNCHMTTETWGRPKRRFLWNNWDIADKDIDPLTGEID